MRRYAIVAVTLVVILSGRQALRAAALSYTVKNLGSYNGVAPTITGLNDSGEVSAFVDTSAGRRAVHYTAASGWQALPGLATTYSAATGINANGDMVGYFLTASGFRGFRLLHGDSGPTTLGVFPGGTYSIGAAISANGDVVGYGDLSNASTRGWRVAATTTTMTMLPLLPGGSSATTCGVNNAGWIVGQSDNASAVQHAYRISPNGSTEDLGSLDGPLGSSTACAIDLNGRVGGNSSSNGNTHAIRYDLGPMVDIDDFGSTSSNVAAVANGVSVGSYTTPTFENRAFGQSGTDPSVDLNAHLSASNGWVLWDALAVNTQGQIAGDGFVNGVWGVFLLTPGAIDTAPPTIVRVTATRSAIWPPDNKMVPVSVTVAATDDVDAVPACSLTSISGGSPDDSAITGAFSANLRAKNGNVYMLTVTCRDRAGKGSSASVSVAVTKVNRGGNMPKALNK